MRAGGLKERERECQADTVPSVSPDAGINPMTLRSGLEANESRSQTLHSLGHPGAPRNESLLLIQHIYFSNIFSLRRTSKRWKRLMKI